MFSLTQHQKKQLEVIEDIERQVSSNAVFFSTVTPVADYESDQRMCLTTVHFPSDTFKSFIYKSIIIPLQSQYPDLYYYPDDAIHVTIRNVRVIHDPPLFSDSDIDKVKRTMETTVGKHKKFRVFYFRLLVFPHNLALIGTTDPELDELSLDLAEGFQKAGIPDDKIYSNSRHFFSNVTIARFGETIPDGFHTTISKLSESLVYPNYTVDSVSLVSSNAVMKYKTVYGTWKLV